MIINYQYSCFKFLFEWSVCKLARTNISALIINRSKNNKENFTNAAFASPYYTHCLPLKFFISYSCQMPLGICMPPRSIIFKRIENDKLLLLPSLHGAYGMWQPTCFLQRNSAEKSLGCPIHWSVELPSCLKLNKGHDKIENGKHLLYSLWSLWSQQLNSTRFQGTTPCPLI